MREADGEDPEKVKEALVCADVMATWAIRQGKLLVALPDQTEAHGSHHHYNRVSAQRRVEDPRAPRGAP